MVWKASLIHLLCSKLIRLLDVWRPDELKQSNDAMLYIMHPYGSGSNPARGARFFGPRKMSRLITSQVKLPGFLRLPVTHSHLCVFSFFRGQGFSNGHPVRAVKSQCVPAYRI